MTGDDEKRAIGFSVFFAIVGVGLIVTAIASDNWVKSDLKGNETDNRSETAEITFGLFKGQGNYDVGLSPRPVQLEIHCNLSESICGYIKVEAKSKENFDERIQKYHNGTGALEDYALFGFALFATTIVMFGLSIVLGLMAIGFAIFNVFGRPIETITGVAGLYVWNGLALLFAVTGIAVYLGLFMNELSNTIVNMEPLQVDGTVWKDSTQFDYSFFLVIGSAGAYLINIVVLLLVRRKCGCSYKSSAEKEVDNGIILY